MSWMQEFKTFALKGNMVDLAIGVIIGAAFGKVVSSLVGDVLMPPLGYIIGGIDFSALTITLKNATATAPAVTINYGKFLNSIIDFVIIAFVIFGVIKVMNRLKSEPAPTMKDCPECLMQIPMAAKKCGHCCSDIS